MTPSNSKFKEHIIMVVIMIINSTYKAQNLPKNSERAKNKKTTQKL